MQAVATTTVVGGVQPTDGSSSGNLSALNYVGGARHSDPGKAPVSRQARTEPAAGAFTASTLPISANGSIPPMPRTPATPSTAEFPSGTPSAPGGASGSGTTLGGAGQGGIQGAVGALLTALLTLTLLRLARRAGTKAVWRCYLPEVPPA